MSEIIEIGNTRVLTLDYPTLTHNRLDSLHWAKKRRLKQRVAWEFFRLLGCKRPNEPYQQVEINVYRYSVGNPETANVYGGLKPYIDCLIFPTRVNPHGIGLFIDDADENLTLYAHKRKSSRRDERTEFHIKRIQ